MDMSSVTTIPARSPFLQYTPCVDCVADGGWQAGENDMRGVDGRLSVGFNFTGTAFSYAFPSPPSEQWNSILAINGTEETATSGTPSYSVERLPQGLHSVQLVLVPPQPDPFSNRSISPFNLSGITIDTGLSLTASSRNTTVDDTAWRNGTVLLSPGWNMMESDDSGAESNFINEEQMQAERWTRTRNYNETLSWTEQRRANTTILFEGEQVWVYGLSGGEAGGYEVLVDGVSRARYNASGGERVYQSLLFTSNLPSGRHNLTLSNLEEGKRLSFDRLVAAAGLTPVAGPTSTPSTSPTASAAPAEVTPHGLSPGAVGGIIVGVLVGLATLIPLILFVLRRRKKRYEDDLRIEKDGSVPETFFRWPTSSRYPTKKDTEGSCLRLPDRGLSPNPTTAESGGGANLGGGASDAGFSLGSTARDAAEEQSRTGLGTVGMGIFKLPTALRKSGSWSFGNGAQSERSFMSDLGSPSSMSHARGHSHSLGQGGRVKDRDNARSESPASFLSFNPKGSKKPDFTISNPIPMTKTAGGVGSGADVAEDSMTPAMAAAVNGRVMSPLTQLKNHPFAGDSKLMPIGLGTSMGTGDAGQQQLEGTRVGRAF